MCSFPLDEGEAFIITLSRYGYLGTAPLHPESALSFKTLELYRVLVSRCPQLSIQTFVKTLCTLQSVSWVRVVVNVRRYLYILLGSLSISILLKLLHRL